MENERHNTLEAEDYCDLDPKKLCDNWCKCIESGEEAYYTILAKLTPEAAGKAPAFEVISAAEAQENGLVAAIDLMDEYPQDPLDGESFLFGDEAVPAEIDPQLWREWEDKLAAIGEDEEDE